MISKTATKPEPRSPRQDHILASAETCFVRNGFHRTTMADIAREAGMSQGNFYRYYVSKEALIIDLAEREAERAAALISDILSTKDRRTAISAVLTRYFVDISRNTAILRLDIWAEASRSTAIAELVDRQEHEARDWLLDDLATIKGKKRRELDLSWTAISACLKGMIVNRALFADYDPQADLEHLKKMIGL